MSSQSLLARLCVHTITTKPLTLDQCLDLYPKYGIKHLTIWRQSLLKQESALNTASSGLPAIQDRDLALVRRQISEAGLSVTSLCRGGFFAATSKDARRRSIEDNLRAIDQAHALGAPLIVLVCGADPGQSLSDSRLQIAESISEILPVAQQANVRLAIEPLHPMYADDRSAINTMDQAHQVCDALGSPSHLGIAIDVYHVWWDSDLQRQIQKAGTLDRLFAFHICDWRTPTTDLLNDRGLMGEGCIPIAEISRWVDAAGFTGPREVEIFSNRLWQWDQQYLLERITQSYLDTCC